MTHSTDSLTGLLVNQTRGADCLAPKQFLPDEWAAVTPDVKSSIEAHLAGCVICQAEKELATAFFSEEGDDQLERRRIARVQSVVDARLGQAGAQTRPRLNRSYAAVAAVMVLGVAAVFAVLVPRDAQSPAPVTRGANVVLVAPLTEQAAPVDRFNWQPVQTADYYQLTVNDPSGAMVYARQSESTMLTLPDTETGWQRPGTTYHWRVVAFDRSGVQVGTSGDGRFRVSPATED